MRRATLAGGGASSLSAVLRLLLIALLALAPARGGLGGRHRTSCQPEGGATTATSTPSPASSPGPYGAPLVGPPGRARGHAYPVQARRTARRDRDERPRRPLRLRAALRPQPAGARRSRREFGRPQRSPAGLRLPAAVLTFGSCARNVIRIVQTYGRRRTSGSRPDAVLRRRGGQERTPAGRARQRPGRCGTRASGSREASAPPPGPHPEGWKGRFRYASSFPYNAGMGNPKLGCPRNEVPLLERRRREQIDARRERRRGSASRRRARAGAARAPRPGSCRGTMTSQP
jgi:hypothetical protein